jgi:hypothetical protein
MHFDEQPQIDSTRSTCSLDYLSARCISIEQPRYLKSLGHRDLSHATAAMYSFSLPRTLDLVFLSLPTARIPHLLTKE